MKIVMQKVCYYLVFYSLGLISLFPFWVLYRVSDFLYILIRIIGYRKEVIMENLKYIEDMIVEKPEYYLWSHKRWKHIKHRVPVIENYDINNE